MHSPRAPPDRPSLRVQRLQTSRETRDPSSPLQSSSSRVQTPETRQQGKNGFGTHTWFLKRIPGTQYPLRNEYTGNFVNGARHGYGKFLYASGAAYEGEWKKNKKHGMGKFIFKNGRIYIGEFQNDLIAEFPHFQMSRMYSPDLSNIRTQSPIRTESIISPLASLDVGSTLGSNIDLEIASLLEVFPEHRRAQELKQVEYAVLRNITELRRIYHVYSSLGHDISVDNTFLMTRMQFWRFLKDCRFHHYNLTLADMDRLLHDNASPDLLHFPQATLLLRTFLSHIVRLSFHIYQQENLEEDTSLVLGFSKIMSQNITPHACQIKGTLFGDADRTVHSAGYMDKCWEIYKFNCIQRSVPPYDRTMTMRHFIWILKNFNIINKELTPSKVVDILACDNPAVHDGADTNLDLEIIFLEFFEALLGCALSFVTPVGVSAVHKAPVPVKALPTETPKESRIPRDVSFPQDLQSQKEELQIQAALEGSSYDTSVASFNSDSTSKSASDKTKKTEVKSKEHLADEKVHKSAMKSSRSKRRFSGHHTNTTLMYSAVSPAVPLQLSTIDDKDLTAESKEKISTPPALQLDVQEEQLTTPIKETTDAVKREDALAAWLNQMFTFFVKIFFPAHEHAEQLREEIPKNRVRLAELERLRLLKDEEAAKIKAIKKAQAEEARRVEEEAERAAERAMAALEAALHAAKEEAEESQISTTSKEELMPQPPAAPAAKQVGKKKKK